MIELVISCGCVWSNEISLFTYRDASQQGRASDLTETSQQESKQSATKKGSKASKSRTKSLSKRRKSTSSFSSSSSSFSSCSSASSSRCYDPIGKQKVSSSCIQTPLFHETSQNLNRSSPTVYISPFSRPVRCSGLDYFLHTSVILLQFLKVWLWLSLFTVKVVSWCYTFFPSLLPASSFIPAFSTSTPIEFISFYPTSMNLNIFLRSFPPSRSAGLGDSRAPESAWANGHGSGWTCCLA